MGPHERFTSLRMSAACVQLDRQQISELVAITANLFEERKRLSFAEVRKLRNELALDGPVIQR